MNIDKARFNMIEQQIKPWKVNDSRLLGAMATIAREQFVPQKHHNLAYADISIPLGHNQTMLPPRELARLIQALKLTGTEKVLEIGCGSGYASALLAKLANKVFSAEIIADFAKSARQRLQKMAFDNVVVEEIDAADGWMAHAPYDAILITSAIPKLTEALKKNLTKNGKVAVILGTANSQKACFCSLDQHGEWVTEELFPTETSLMINAEQPNQFEF